MGNKDKRSRRAKEKAKKRRLARQSKSPQHDTGDDVVRISEEIVELFKTLPPPSPDFDGLAEIMEYAQNSQTDAFEDFEASVTTLYVLYGHWFTSGSNELIRSELAAAVMLLSEKTEFRAKLNEGQSL